MLLYRTYRLRVITTVNNLDYLLSLKGMVKYLYCILLLFLCYGTRAQNSDATHMVVLGVAQDGGYPHMGCTRPCCNRAWKNKDMARYVVSLALVDPGTGKWWLFEATPDIKEQLHYFQTLTKGIYNFLPDGIFITHAHIGHYTGLIHLGKEVMSTREIPVYVLPKLKAYLETNGPWSQLVKLHNIKLVEMKEHQYGQGLDDAVNLSDNITVQAYRVPHRDEYSETAGFRVATADKKYLFIPDINKWEKWDVSVIDAVKDVDIALVDATFYDTTDLPARNLANVPHPLVRETRAIFEKESKETRAKVHLIHFNHTNPLLWDEGKQKEINKAGFNYAKQGERL